MLLRPPNGFHRDIIAIGGSAGALDALCDILAQPPRRLASFHSCGNAQARFATKQLARNYCAKEWLARCCREGRRASAQGNLYCQSAGPTPGYGTRSADPFAAEWVLSRPQH